MRDWIKSEHGQAIVEMAMVLPLIVLLLMGIVEFGRIGNAYLTVTNAARQGARYGVVGNSNTEIMDKIKGAAIPLNPEDLVIIIDPEINRSTGDDISINVSYPVEIIAPVIGNIVGNPFIVSSNIIMRIE